MFYIYADGESIYDPTIESLYLFEPKLKLEFGKAGSLEFTIPSNHAYFNNLKQLKTIVTVSLDDEELFRGRVLSIEQNIQNFKTIYCEGDLAFLVDSVQKGEKYKGKTHDLFRKIIANHNKRVEDYKKFTVGNITIDNRDIILVGHSEEGSEDINVGDIDYKQIAIDSIVDNWNNTYDYIQTCLIDYCGGYLRTRRDGNTIYLDYLKEYAGTETQQIAFGENILDLTKEVNAEDLFTVLIPLGDDNLTISSVNGGSDELVDKAAVQQYGRIIRTNVFSNVNEASTLLENAKRYLASNVNVPTTITVNAIDMHLVDSSITAIHVGNRVHVNASPHSLVEDLTCTAIEYDLANPENNTYTFGNPKQSLTERYKEDKRKSNDTYGNGDGYSSSYGGASAGGAVAKRAAEETKKETDDKLKKFEEITDIEDNEDGIKTIDAFYREYKNTKMVLENQVGIHFDAEHGNTDLGSITRRLDEATGKYDTAIAQIQSHTGVVDGKLEAVERMTASIGDRQATFEVEAREMVDGKIETAIRGKADILDLQAVQASIKGYDEEQLSMKRLLKKWVGLDFDAKTGTVNLGSLAEVVNSQGQTIQKNTAQLTTVANQQKVQATQIAKVEKNGKEIAASITTTATSLGSRIDLKADKTVVDGDLKVINGKLSAMNAEIDNLKAKSITTDELSAKLGLMSTISVNNLYGVSLNAGSITVGDPESGGALPVATELYVRQQIAKIGKPDDKSSQHSHTITENADGTITLGYACSEPQHFNIRATKTYKEGVAAAVAAVEIKNFRLVKDGADIYYPTSHNIQTHIVASYMLGDKQVTRSPITITVSGAEAYNAGLAKGAESQAEAIEEAAKSVSIKSLSQTDYTVSTSDKTVSYTVTARLSNNNPATTYSKTIDASAIYTTGRNSVKVSSITKVANSDYYNASKHTTRITAIATADNNETKEVYLYTNTTAYDRGKSDGITEGKKTGESSVTIKNLARTKADVYSSSTHKYTVYVTATASNGKTLSGTFATDTTAYDTGVKSVTVNKPTISNIKNDLNNHAILFDVTAKASNGNVGELKQRSISALAHYNLGLNSSKEAYNPTSIAVTPGTQSYNINTHVFTRPLTLQAKSKDGTVRCTGSYTVSVSGNDAFNQGSDYAKSKWGVTSNNQVSLTSALNANDTGYNLNVEVKSVDGTVLATRSGTTGTAAYTNGRNSVDVNSLGLSTTQDPSFDGSFSSSYYGNYPVIVKLNNNKSPSKMLRINLTNVTKNAYNAGKSSVDTDSYYDSGYSAGYNAGAPTDVGIVTYYGTQYYRVWRADGSYVLI